MQQMNAKQVANYIKQADTKPTLVDVREPNEIEICAIDGAINIPLSNFQPALDQLDPEQEIVLICHHGIRSLRAGMFLEEQGYTKLINMLGGIDDWACEVDPQMRRY